MNLKALHPKRRKNWTLTNEMPSSGKINNSFIKTDDVELAECFPTPRGLTPRAPTTKAIESFSRMKKSLIQSIMDGDAAELIKYLDYLKTVIEDNSLCRKRVVALKINAADEWGRTALHHAARKAKTSFCKLLHEKSKYLSHNGSGNVLLDVVAKDYEGATSLHYACRRSRQDVVEENWNLEDNLQERSILGDKAISELNDTRADCVQYLLAIGEKDNIIEIKDIHGHTSLHWAAKTNCVIAAYELLVYASKNKKQLDEKKQLLNSQGHRGATPLHICGWYGSTETAVILIKMGANVNLLDKEEKTSLYYAANGGHIEMCKLLLQTNKQMGNQKKLENVYSPLLKAAEKNHLQIVQLLLHGEKSFTISQQHKLDRLFIKDRKERLYQKDRNGDTALHKAAKGGCIRIVQVLLEQGAAVNEPNNYGRTALHNAVRYNHDMIVEFLLKTNADPNSKDNCKWTPLLLAASYGHVSTIELLLEQKVNKSDIDEKGNTCLHLAALNNHILAINVMIPRVTQQIYGVQNRKGNTALHIAAEKGFTEIVKALLAVYDLETVRAKNDDSEQAAIHLAVANNHIQVVQLIIGKDKTAKNAQDDYHNSPILTASYHNAAKVVEYLIDCGVNIESRNELNLTPLLTSAVNNSCKSAEVLLRAGANLNAQGWNNQSTALIIAAKFGHTAMIKLLLDHNADLSITSSRDYNALEVSISNNQKECAIAILQSSKWKAAMRNVRIKNSEGEITTPMREMILHMPEAAQYVFGKCTKIPSDIPPDDQNYKVKFDFEFLDDMYSTVSWKAIEHHKTIETAPCFSVDGNINDKQLMPYSLNTRILNMNHPMVLVADTKDQRLLCHPIVAALLHHKWKRYGRNIHYSLILMHFMYLCALCLYFIFQIPPYAVEIQNSGRNACYVLKAGTNENWKESCTCCQRKSWQKTRDYSLMYIIFAMSLVGILKEAIQLKRDRMEYLKKAENYLDVAIYTISVLSTLEYDAETQVTGILKPWQWKLGAICVYLACGYFMLLLRRLPSFGIYVIMYLSIVNTFTSFALPFLPLVMGFAFSFYMLLQNQSYFSSWFEAAIKSSIMMLGEIDYTTIFYGCDETTNDCKEYTAGGVYYYWATMLMFMMFIPLISILTTNLLVGLAVDDIKAIQDRASVEKTAMKIRLAIEVEMMMPEPLRKYYSIGCCTIYPNKKKKTCMLFYEDDVVTAKACHESVGLQKDYQQILKESDDRMEKSFQELKKQMSSLREQNEIILQLHKERTRSER